MNVARVGMLNNVSSASFGQDQSQKAEQKAAPSYENPISRKKEKALATLSVIGGSAVLVPFVLDDAGYTGETGEDQRF